MKPVSKKRGRDVDPDTQQPFLPLPPWQEKPTLIAQLHNQPPQDLSFLLKNFDRYDIKIDWPGPTGLEFTWHGVSTTPKVQVELTDGTPNQTLNLWIGQNLLCDRDLRLTNQHVDWFYGNKYVGQPLITHDKPMRIWHNHSSPTFLSNVVVYYCGFQWGMSVEPVSEHSYRLREKTYFYRHIATYTGKFIRLHLDTTLLNFLCDRTPDKPDGKFNQTEASDDEMELAFLDFPDILDLMTKRKQKQALLSYVSKVRTTLRKRAVALLSGLHGRTGARGLLARVARRSTIFDVQAIGQIIRIALGPVKKYKK